MNNTYLSKLDIFGFTHPPFCKPLTTPYLDDTRTHALEKLQHFLDYRGFAVISAPPGCGKTMILHHLTEKLNPNSSKIMYIPFPILSEIDMLRAISFEMELEPCISKSVMLRNIQTRIKDIQPTNPVLVLDEIQKISHQTLELVRLLTNFNFDGKNLFSIIMAGTDHFLQELRLSINESLRQRITLFIRLHPMTRTDTPKYIAHHFAQAGAHQTILVDQAATLIHDTTSGIPRLINNLTLSSLQEAAYQQSTTINLQHVHAAMHTALIPKRENQE